MTTVLVTIAVILGVLGALYLSLAIVAAILGFRHAKQFNASFNDAFGRQADRIKTKGWEGGA